MTKKIFYLFFFFFYNCFFFIDASHKLCLTDHITQEQVHAPAFNHIMMMAVV